MLKKTTDQYLTHSGLLKLQKEYHELLEKKKPYLMGRIVRAREYGDVAESQEYLDAQSALYLAEQRIAELEKALKHYRLINSSVKAEFIVIGSRVVVDMGSVVDEFEVVNTIEADPAQKKISDVSPLGRALLGAKIGDVVEVFNSPVKRICRILEIK